MPEPRIDAYGTYGDGTFLADYLEVLALRGISIDEGRLADVLQDSSWESWSVRPGEWFISEGQEREQRLEELSATESAARIFELLRLRSLILKERYPFTVGVGLEWRGEDALDSPYVGLLAITLAHAYGLRAGEPVTDIFEDVVEQAFRSKGLSAVNVGRYARTAPNFDQGVVDAAESIDLVATPAAAPRRLKAQDERVDLISHLAWQDGRPSLWVMLGQATCAKSDEWHKKIDDPPLPLWQKYLGLHIEPIGFLAVPHHVEPIQLSWLVMGSKKLVFDRLRLSAPRIAVLAEERRLIELLLSEDWSDPTE